MKNVIVFLLLVSLLSHSEGMGRPAFAATSTRPSPRIVSPRELRAMRQQAANRVRRIIFNNDGDDAALGAAKATPEAVLAVRTTPLLGSQVDSIFYSTHGSFGAVRHRTAVGEGPTKIRIHPQDVSYDLIQAGTDSLQIMTDYGRRHNMEIFWSMRMNDTHDGMNYDWAPKVRSQFKLTHPQYLVGTKDHPSAYGYWTAVDYSHPQVRDLAFRLAEEVCRNYSIDGIELDFFRWLLYFKSVANGGQASSTELAAMSDLVHRIRVMTETEGMRRGKPILVAIRVPDSVGYCRAIGLDVERWLSEGWVDLLIAGGDFQLNPWETSVSLGHRHGVKVYCDLDPCTSVALSGAFNRNSLEAYRARAMAAWQAGTDGIYVFNHFNPRNPFWWQLGDPDTLRSLNKVYFANVTGCRGWHRPDQFLADGNRFRGGPALHPDDPQFLIPGKPLTVEMTVGDDVLWGKSQGVVPDIQCCLAVAGLDRAEQLQVKLNGTELTGGALEDQWLTLPVSPERVKRGINRFDVTFRPDVRTNAASEPWDMDYQADHLLKYPSQLPWRRLFAPQGAVEEIRDETLFFADRGKGPADLVNLVYPWSIRPEDRTILEARVKVVDSRDPLGVCIRVSNGKMVEYLTLEAAKASLKFANLSAPVTTTDGFHTYRVIFKDSDIRVFVDSRLVLDGTGKFTASVSDARTKLRFPDTPDEWPNKRSLLFGSASGPGTGEACWAFIRYRTDTRTLRDLVLPIRYLRKR